MILDDATEVLDAESLEHQALGAGSTNRANRAVFEEHVLVALAAAKRSNERRAVLTIAMDRFDDLDGSLGSDLLEQVSERLVAALRESDTIVRLGGDEFAVLAGGAADLAAAAAVASKIHETFRPGFVVDGEVIHVSAPIGIALFPEHGRTPAGLLRCADAAMSMARRAGTGQAVFDAAHKEAAAHHLALLVDVRQCLARDELVLHYQPKVDLGAREIIGVEALLRWRHPVKGLLSPASFMPEMERTELIEPVTRWVIDEALRQQRLWRDDGMDLTMAVNISPHSLRPDSNLPDTVAELTESWSTAPNRLTLELTESALSQAAAPDAVRRLHAVGEMMSIDDFGTGYSSVAHLHRLALDEIKIDQSFVTGVRPASDNAVVVRAMVDLAHNLGLAVVAEGVEDEVSKDLLDAYGCDSVQGYLFSHPCQAERLTTWLTESPYGGQQAAREASFPSR
jgi:diguanylate cyclase (GGDEF)-like protein